LDSPVVVIFYPITSCIRVDCNLKMSSQDMFVPHFSPRAAEDAPSIRHENIRARSLSPEPADESPARPHVGHHFLHDSNGQDLFVAGFKDMYMPRHREEPDYSNAVDLHLGKLQTDNQSVYSRPESTSRSFRSQPSRFRQEVVSRQLSWGGSQFSVSADNFHPPPARSIHPAGMRPTTLGRVLTYRARSPSYPPTLTATLLARAAPITEPVHLPVQHPVRSRPSRRRRLAQAARPALQQ
jgi:hypothetical protein